MSLIRSFISGMKRSIVPKGVHPRTILAGPYRGLTMYIDLQTNSQLWFGTFEREVAGWLSKLARGIQTGIDLGAAHGEYSLFLLARTKAARIIAFEPDDACLASFRANLALNSLAASDRLRIYAQAVGDGQGDSGLSLDNLDVPTEGPCLLKIDVEGHEASVLRGCRKLLSAPNTRIILETHGESAERDCVAILQSAGYSIQVVEKRWWRAILPEYRPLPHNRWLVAWKGSAVPE